MIQPVDSSILHEIARVVGTRSKVPERVRVRGKEYQLTYLDDHKQRIEDALRRHDPDRLNMLYGQLASKVKYQLLRQVATRRTGQTSRSRSDGNEKRRASTRGTHGRVSRNGRPAKVKAASQKSKSQSTKKRRVALKKSTVRKKPATSRAARR